ncbi:polysaccharide biosynthesis tyrosine autokinase [Gordonia alkanivorans]|uniref:polysaccharide biosynthesis tyrosine autokinase n=1 Tax=Gordonia alkanivorans TaxID=84096 RepID=UPI00244A924A|nr:polysaccharide biosynthesis tyrosine autokinase [Gordonia alkanivorans]MDH3026963.1 polysaccharide biosynthesis tyrosine autokinase [Gordonia alkanivorans]
MEDYFVGIFKRFGSVFLREWWIVGVLALIAAVLGLGFSLLQTPLYSSTATLYVTSGTDANSQSAYQGSLASQQRVASYSKLVTSDVVLQGAVERLSGGIVADDVRAHISASVTPATVLLAVTALDPDPAKSAVIVNAVADSMIDYVRALEAPSTGGEPLARLTLVTPGSVPANPATPDYVQNVLLSLVVGGIIGVVVVYLRYRLDTKIRSEGDVNGVGLPAVLSVIPKDETLVDGEPAIDFSRGSGPSAESYRKLRTNLSFACVDEPSSMILVTSPSSGEGKTTTAVNLAAALAESGSRVILVDADLRIPMVASRLRLNGQVGLTDHLRGEAELADLLQPSGLSGLTVLASGQIPPNPAELLGSERMGEALRQLSGLCDIVLVDSPPVLPVADASVLAKWVDGAVLVVRAGVTRVPSLSRAVDQLKASGVRLLGGVLNDVPSATAGYYGASSYGYGAENVPQSMSK